MRTLFAILFAGGMLAATLIASAQPPRSEKKDGPGKAVDAEAALARFMAFDKNKDGKLTKDELTDERLQAMFDRADANKDGVVTKEELTALLAREGTAARDGDKGVPPDGGPRGRGGRPGGPGAPVGRGPGGPGAPGGPGGFGGPPQPGQVLPARLQETLKLTEDQKKQIADIQKEVDSKLEKILTEDQKKQLKEMRDRGPGGPGGRGGPPGGNPQG